MTRSQVLVASIVGLGLCLPAPVLGDWWDSFDDSEIYMDPNDPDFFDPNLWDPCNPHWYIYPAVEMPGTGMADPNGQKLRLYVQPTGFLDIGFIAALVEKPLGQDPNKVWFSDVKSHYIASWVQFQDPDVGEVVLIVHGSAAAWGGYALGVNAGGWFYMDGIIGLDWSYAHYDVYRRYDLDLYNGFWMALQLIVDDCNYPNHQAGDPNGVYIYGAAWNGDRDDWDGQWDLAGWTGMYAEPNDWYWEAGLSAVATYVNQSGGRPADSKFDNVEAVHGHFIPNPVTLTVKKKDCDSYCVFPNIPHPDGGEKRRYSKGMTVVFDKVVPTGNKVFKKWTIKGPNDSGDPLYQVVNDTNEVLYLTVDGDYLVKATCKCGGGGVEPFGAMALLVLALAVVIRRFQVTEA